MDECGMGVSPMIFTGGTPVPLLINRKRLASMSLRLKPIDLSQIHTTSVRRRTYHLSIDQLADVPRPADSLQDFFKTMPKVGAASALWGAARLFAQCAVDAKPIVWILDGSFMGAGLTRPLIHLVQRGLVQCLVMNGEAAVRDYELAFHGATVEDRPSGLDDGMIGLARETGEGLNGIINEGVKRGFSIGECLGRGILERQPKYYNLSLLATGTARLTPSTVHLALGADGFHRYPGADGAMLGKGSLKDAQILSGYLQSLTPGATLVATHDDAALSQVFVHAYALARNLNADLGGFHLVDLGSGASALKDLPGLDQTHAIDGPLELTVPLLLGALFSMVE